jgi:hypothetical protein
LKQLWTIAGSIFHFYSLQQQGAEPFRFLSFPVFFESTSIHIIPFNRQTYLEDNCAMWLCYNEELYSSSNHLPEKKYVSFIALNNTCSDLAWVRKLPDDLLFKSAADIGTYFLPHRLIGCPGGQKNISRL